MYYQQRSLKKSRKQCSGEAPYCRKENWWRNPDIESKEDTSAHRHVVKRSGYVLPSKGKTWSILVLTSGLQGLTEAKAHSNAAELKKEFKELVRQWKRETFSLSSLTKIYAHPAYQRIMAMGTAGIPFVLMELQEDQGYWFYALKFMAGQNVSAGIDTFEGAKAAWLEWGYRNNYILSL